MYIKRNDKVHGPFTSEQVATGLKNGKLTGQELVSKSENGPWKTLSKTNLAVATFLEEDKLAVAVATPAVAQTAASITAAPVVAPVEDVETTEDELRQVRAELELARAKAELENLENLENLVNHSQGLSLFWSLWTLIFGLVSVFFLLKSMTL